jgi:hypothetical protein
MTTQSEHEYDNELTPIENMALTIALAQIARGDDPPPNTTAVLIWALARLVGREVDA